MAWLGWSTLNKYLITCTLSSERAIYTLCIMTVIPKKDVGLIGTKASQIIEFMLLKTC